MTRRAAIKILVDGQLVKGVSDLSLLRALRDRRILRSDDERISFCGVLGLGEQVYAFLPKTADITSHGCLRIANLTVRAIAKYQQTRTLRGDPFQVGGGVVLAALQLLKDWAASGAIEERRRINGVRSGGKVDWPRTIRRGTLFSLDGRPLYMNPALWRTVSKSESNFAKIHRWAVRYSDFYYGWILSEGSLVAPDLLGSSIEAPFPVSQMLSTLRTLRARSFGSRSLKVIELIKQLLNGVEGTASGAKVTAFGMTDFQYVWQDMCQVVLGGTSRDLARKLPQPKYHGFGLDTKPRQLPDALIERENKAAVVDAKYYDTSITLPGWPDLIKQFLYAFTLRRAIHPVAVGNFLAFPTFARAGNITRAIPPRVTLEAEESNIEMGQIFCLHFPLEDFLGSYIAGRVDEHAVKSVFDLIEEPIALDDAG